MRRRNVGIIGGGPGGLMTAYCLQKHANVPFRATIVEATSRLGGKILTSRFDAAAVMYEAGAAELYDYSVVGHDPLRALIAELGLATMPMDGCKVIMNDSGAHRDDAYEWGSAERLALEKFDTWAHECMSPRQFYDSDWKDAAGDPLGQRTFCSVLENISDKRVRRYVQTMVHSDLATEPHQTNATYGLHNYLMNDPAYMRLYTIDGGIERLPQELASRIDAEILLNQTVTRVEKVATGLRVVSCQGNERIEREFDFVVVALPNHLLPTIEWGGPVLAEAMQRHHAYYDYPAHYVRVTILFERPFWRQHINESFFMLDAFGGCCVYDESSRNSNDSHGVLGWLIGGEPALRMSGLSDGALIEKVLESLPPSLQAGRECFVEGRVHRWANAVNGMPAGYPPQKMDVRHVPEPTQHPNLLIVGDYLFDSTLNGVHDSADYVAEWLAGEL
ncbi:MAG: amine oxidase [Gemmataceae bacterium]|nr:amine oxidase [Gemmataceae bacterium]